MTNDGLSADVALWRSSRLQRDEQPPKERTEFQRDVDRIWYVSALRRLGGVTQIVSDDDGSVVHNRLTHTLKVASMSRRLAERILKESQRIYEGGVDEYLARLGGLDPDVAQAAGLGHDLGHAPFGHHGESVLDSLVGEKAGGFNGNAQAFRILNVLAFQDVNPGLNLTRATLNALVKYPWLRSQESGHDSKWGAYRTEEPLLKKLRSDRPSSVLDRLALQLEVPTLEAAIMDWADDVTYAVHDVEDFMRARLIPFESLKAQTSDWALIVEQGRARIEAEFPDITDGRILDAVKRVTGRSSSTLMGYSEPFDGSRRHRALLKMWASEAIGHYLGHPRIANPDEVAGPLLAIDDSVREEIVLLKELAWFYVINRPGLASIQVGQATMLTNLYERLLDSVEKISGKNSPLRSTVTGDARIVPQSAVERLAEGDEAPVIVRDLLASLTERQVERMYMRLNGHHLGSVADAIF